MFTIFDLMRAGQGGSDMDAMARQFGVSQDQAQRATEALIPAFMLAFQRNAVNPNAFTNLMGTGAQGAVNPAQLFGSPDLTRQVAEQAAHWSGLSAQVLQQMMPVVAGAFLGVLSKFSEVMRTQAARGAAPGASAPASAPEQIPNPYAAWAAMMQAMMGQRPPEADKPREPAPHASPPPEPEPETAPPPQAGEADAMQQALGQLLHSTREAQAQYLASLQKIFDQFLGGEAKR